MTLPWFRFYTEVLNDPKVQSLEPKIFKAWINLLCVVASTCNVTCNASHVSFHLRCTEDEAKECVEKLVNAGLFYIKDNILTPHGWEKRQYKSDTSNERVKRYRDKKRNVTLAVTVTPPDTDTDTDTEKNKKENSKSEFSFRVKSEKPKPKNENFEMFWEKYPTNGRGKGTKKIAEKSFSKIKISFDVLIKAVENYEKYLLATGEMNADASTWLNQNRWETDYKIPTPIQKTEPVPDYKKLEEEIYARNR